MLDSMIYDKLIAEPGMVERLNALSKMGLIILLSTHIQEDQLADIPDPAKKSEVSRIVRRCVPTSGALVGISKVGMCTVGNGGRGGVTVADVLTKGGGHAHDALIATTAAKEADVLVTDEKRLPKRVKATKSSFQVWSFDQFKSHVFGIARP